ncbi:phage protease [Aureimonas sp. SK2]|uniref:phage protease n=1 Tax=Aureimonas sp. SK2 TaxID=3015992 RepID=UPI0024442779|nr:phage protease [Aureimonas sp. SK2]
MNTRSSTSQLPDHIAAGDVVVALAADPAEAWVKLTPRGKVTTRPGPVYDFDPEALAARFQADDVKLAIDLDHGIARLASQGHTVAAVGWIEELQARDDGLYGRVDWLDAGKAVLAARSHRYVSPTFHHENGRATWLHSVALVTAPALSNMPALADASGASPEPSMTKAIATALGLQAEASEAACLSAITTLQSEKVEKAVHDATLATLDATKTELDGLKASIRKGAVDALLEGALKDKKIVPAQREQFASLCATDAGLDQVKALLDATPKGLKDSGLDDRTVDPGAGGGDADVDPVALAADAQKLVSAAAAAGNTLTIQAAVAQVMATKKKAAA